MPLTLPDHPELLRLIRSRNRAGAEALYDQYGKLLSLAIFRIVRKREVTNDLLEKTICEIWYTADQYNEQQLPLLTWMLNIAKRFAKEYIATPVVAISA